MKRKMLAKSYAISCFNFVKSSLKVKCLIFYFFLTTPKKQILILKFKFYDIANLHFLLCNMDGKIDRKLYINSNFALVHV